MYFAEEPEHIRPLRDTLRRFVAAELPPELRRRLDREHRFPPELFRKLAELGVCGLTIEEEYGGHGRDLVAAVAVIEELCRGGAFLAGPFIHCAFYGGMNISENGSEEQKRALLPRLAKGELLFAYGLSEPEVGGDLASVTTTAVRSEDGRSIRINGFKRWCTGADWVDYIYCLVRSGPEEARYKNLSLVLVPPSTPGVRIHPIEHTNLRYTLSSDVIFEDVEIPMDHVVWDTFFKIAEPPRGRGGAGGRGSLGRGFGGFGGFGGRGAPTTYQGIFEDNDPKKRLMVIANYNGDIGEFWEWSDTGFVPIDLSNDAYKLGVDYVIYGMTH